MDGLPNRDDAVARLVNDEYIRAFVQEEAEGVMSEWLNKHYSMHLKDGFQRRFVLLTDGTWRVEAPGVPGIEPRVYKISIVVEEVK